MLVSTVLSADYLGRQFRCTSDPIELGLNLNCLTLMIFLKEFSKINGKKAADNTKSQKTCNDLNIEGAIFVMKTCFFYFGKTFKLSK